MYHGTSWCSFLEDSIPLWQIFSHFPDSSLIVLFLGSLSHGVYQSPVLVSLCRPFLVSAAVVAANSLQSCPTLCNLIESSPPGSAVPGIFQAKYFSGLHCLLLLMSSMYQSHNSLCRRVTSCTSAFLDVRASFILLASLKCLAHSGCPMLICSMSE